MNKDNLREQLDQVAGKSANILLDNILKKHGVSLNSKKRVSPKVKRELKQLVHDLQKSVEELSRKHES